MEHFEILFQDEHILVVNKPEELALHKNAHMARDADYLLKSVGQEIGCSVYNVHRLDAKTSGIVLLALSPEGANILSKQFQNRSVKKTYHAVVKGEPETSGCFDKPVLIKKKGQRKPAITYYKVLKTVGTSISYKDIENVRLSLVEIQPETGRWHQIRQHFAMNRFDIIGDTHHGDWTLNKIVTAQTEAQRLCLHASRLEFIHPFSNEKMVFECDYPEIFNTILNTLNA